MLREDAEKKVRDKAAKDPEFRKRLLADPRKAISEVLGSEVPAGQNIRVVEEGPNESVLVIPAAFQELSDDALETVAGGY